MVVVRLTDLPVEVAERIVMHLSLHALVAVHAVSRLLHGAPGGCSPVEYVLSARARIRGHTRTLPVTGHTPRTQR